MPLSQRMYYRRLRRRLSRLLEALALNQQRRFYVLAVLIGGLSGLSAVAFHQSIHWAEENWIYRMAELPGSLALIALILMPAVGGLIVGFLIKHWAPEAAGSGIPQTKAAYYLKFGRIRFRAALSKFILGTISIGSGASLGREGLTVQLSAALASSVGRWFGIGSETSDVTHSTGLRWGNCGRFQHSASRDRFRHRGNHGRLKAAGIRRNCHGSCNRGCDRTVLAGRQLYVPGPSSSELACIGHPDLELGSRIAGRVLSPMPLWKPF